MLKTWITGRLTEEKLPGAQTLRTPGAWLKTGARISRIVVCLADNSLYFFDLPEPFSSGATIPWVACKSSYRAPRGDDEYVRLGGFLLVVAEEQPGYIVGQAALDAQTEASLASWSEKNRRAQEICEIPEELLAENNSSAMPPAPVDETPESR